MNATILYECCKTEKRRSEREKKKHNTEQGVLSQAIGWMNRCDSRTQEEAGRQVVWRQMKHERYSGAARPVWLRAINVLVVQLNTKTTNTAELQTMRPTVQLKKYLNRDMLVLCI